MAWRTTVLIGMTVIGMASGAYAMLEVHTREDFDRYRHQQQIEQAAEMVDRDNQRGIQDALNPNGGRPGSAGSEPVRHAPRLRIRP